MTNRPIETEDIDNLSKALLAVTHELWVAKDRLAVLEAVLAEAGLLPPDAIDRHVPADELAESLAAERQRLITAVLDALGGRTSSD